MARGDEKKKDHGKPMWDLLPWKQVGHIVDVLTEAVREKYKPHSWKTVPGARERYFAAAQRHIIAWWHGEWLDPDDNLPHLAHAACCLLFLMWFDDNEGEGTVEANDTLIAGCRVKRASDGLMGIVLPSGPYGDDPFQIQDTKGHYHSFIDHNGSSRHNAYVWKKVAG